jgi:hypothetical protein
MARRPKYVARFERDENDYWSVIADCGQKRTAISDGQTLPKARKRIRQSIAGLLEVAEDSFDIVEDVVLPAAAKRALEAFEVAQVEAREKAEALEEARQKAALALKKHGVKLGDIGQLLGVSKQRASVVINR